jgi:F-type H+-transporting ATPase subunit b
MKAMKRFAYGVAGTVAVASQGAYASSLPQMDPTWYANQLLWLAISFGALYAMVSLFIAPSIKSVLSTRANAINEAIREAEHAKSTAEATRSDANNSGQTARVKAAEMMAKAQTENSVEATEAFAKLDQEITRRADHAAAVLEDSVKKATAGIAEAAQSLASSMAEKLLSPSASTDAAEPKLKLAVKR